MLQKYYDPGFGLPIISSLRDLSFPRHCEARSVSRSNLSFAFPIRIGYQRLPRRPKCGLLAMTLEEDRSSGCRHCESLPLPRHCEASERPKQSPRANSHTLPKRHCEGHGSGPWQSLFCVPNHSGYEKIAASPKIRAPRNDGWGNGRPFGCRHCEPPLFPVPVIASLRKQAWQSLFWCSL